MKKWVILALFAIFFTAVIMRLFPLTQYAIWGSDTGEYYNITKQLASDGYVSTNYNGWGFGYPYFPGMFYLSGAAHLLMGMDVLWATIVVIPVVASLSVLIVFFLGRMLFQSNGAGILAGAFIAVAIPHVFATSHPMPGSLGDMLFISSLLLFIATLKNKKFFFLLILCSLALIITHHLSSYFFFIMAFGGLFIQEILQKEEKKETRLLWIFLAFFLTFLVLFWVLAAEPFAEEIVSGAFDVPLWALLLGGYLLLFSAYILIKIRRRVNWSYEPKYPDIRTRLVMFFLLLTVIFSVLAIITFIKMPGTNIELSPQVLLLFSPFIILMSFASVGSGYLRFFKNGMALYGWIIASMLSLLIGILTASKVLLVYRHPQYIMLPVALLLSIGMVMIFRIITSDGRNPKKTIIMGLVAVLLGLAALSAYPPKEIMGGFQEGTSQGDMQAVAWAKYSLGEGATVASDHRMSSMLFGFGGVNATWDKAYNTLHASSYEDCKDEIQNVSTPSGRKSINHVFLDDDIKEGVALLQWENAEPMSKEAQDKFKEAPFVKLYESNGVEVYGIVE